VSGQRLARHGVELTIEPRIEILPHLAATHDDLRSR
jgi:hypothetical protein